MNLTLADAQLVAQRSAMRYDRDGDGHYDILSALQKSIRGSDPDAALHYLARLLEAGDLISACRRILVIAAEDVGLAYPQAMPIVKACVDSANMLGLPEARIPWRRRCYCWPPPRNPTPPSAGLTPLRRMCAKAIRRYSRPPDGQPLFRRQEAGAGLTYQYPHAYPNHYGKAAVSAPTPWWGGSTTGTATTRQNRRPRLTGSGSGPRPSQAHPAASSGAGGYSKGCTPPPRFQCVDDEQLDFAPFWLDGFDKDGHPLVFLDAGTALGQPRQIGRQLHKNSVILNAAHHSGDRLPPGQSGRRSPPRSPAVPGGRAAHAPLPGQYPAGRPGSAAPGRKRQRGVGDPGDGDPVDGNHGGEPAADVHKGAKASRWVTVASNTVPAGRE